MTKFSILEAGLNVFDDEYKGTPEEKKAIMMAVKADPGAVIKIAPSSLDFDIFTEKLEPHIREYENEAIVDDIAEGNYLIAGERAIGGALESLPSILAAGLGLGGFVVLGVSSAGGKFEEEFEEDASVNTGVLVANALATGAVESGFEIVTRGILKKAGILSNQGNMKAAKDLIRGGSEALVKSLGINTLSEAGSEAATRTTTLLLDAATLPGRDINLARDWKLIADDAIVGGVFGIKATSIGRIKNRNVDAVSAAEYILMPDQIKQVVNNSGKKISKLYKDKNTAGPEGRKLINEAIDLETARILNIKKQNSRALNDMTPSEIKSYATNKTEINKLKATINKPGQQDVVKELAKDKLKNLQEVNKILFKESSDRRIDRNIESIENIAKDVEGLTINSLNNSKEVLEFIKENKIPLDEKKASEDQGFIYQNPNTGEQVIVINKDIAKRQKAVNIAGHEFLHALLFNTVKSSPETQVALGESLNRFIENIDISKIKNSDFAKRLELYKDSDKATQGEEALTLFSDALSTGDLKFNESVFTRIGNVLRKTLQGLGVKIKFNEGKDVFNFIKDYNKSIAKGRLTKAQAKAVAEGVKGKLVTPKVEQVDEQIVKEAKSEEASQDVQRIYDEQGPAGAFEIIEKFKPITSKLVERRSEAPNFDRQLLTDEIETGKRGILDLISEYKPESGVPLAAYINKFLPARAIEASKRVLGEEFTADVTEARGVVAAEVTDDVTVEKEVRGVRKPTETTRFSETALSELGVETKAQAEKQISDATKEAFKGKEITRFGETRNIPQAVADIYGKMFGVNPQTIVDKRRNYQKTDAEGLTRIKQYLIDNAPSDFARLPKTKDAFGKGTFIPKNVTDALYTDGKLTGTLKDYLDLIRQKPVKPIYRDRVGQTIRGLFNTSIRNRMLEDLIPEPAKRAQAGAKFSKAQLSNITQSRNINQVLKLLDIDSASVPDNMRAEIQASFENAIREYKLTENAFLAGAFAFSGAKYKRKADGNVYYKLTNGKEMMGIPRTDSEGNIKVNKNNKKLFNQPTAEQVEAEFGKGVKLLAARGRLYYGVTDPAYKKALYEARKNSKGKQENKAKRVNINDVNTDKGIAQAKINMEVLDDVVRQLDKAVKDGMPKELAAMVIAQGYQATTGLIKIAAPFRYFSKKQQYGTSIKQKTGDKFREEHNPPASVVGASIIYGLVTNNTNKIMADVKKNYYQTKLSKLDDQKLDEAKLDAILPVGTTIADNPAIRFIEAGIDLNSIINYKTGKTMAEELGVSLNESDRSLDNIAEQNKILKDLILGKGEYKNPQAYLNNFIKLSSKTKASKVNNNNTPSNVKFSKAVTNQKTLDNLSKIDEALSIARNPNSPVKDN